MADPVDAAVAQLARNDQDEQSDQTAAPAATPQTHPALHSFLQELESLFSTGHNVPSSSTGNKQEDAALQALDQGVTQGSQAKENY